MVHYSAVLASNGSYNPSYRPTALFVGGTSGIGEGAAVALARATKGNAHIIICGRNKASADRIMESFPQAPTSQYEFNKCDASLMKNVVKACREVKSRITTLNYIVLTQGEMPLGRSIKTQEGIDQTFALSFYSRWKFIDELIPCLQTAVGKGQDARVISVLGAGKGAPLDTSDFGGKKNRWVASSKFQHRTYNDIMVKEYAARYPQMSFTHITPGWVITPMLTNQHWIVSYLVPFLLLFANSMEQSGQWMLYVLQSPQFKRGAFHLSHILEPVPLHRVHCREGDREKLVEHYEAEIANALAT